MMASPQTTPLAFNPQPTTSICGSSSSSSSSLCNGNKINATILSTGQSQQFSNIKKCTINDDIVDINSSTKNCQSLSSPMTISSSSSSSSSSMIHLTKFDNDHNNMNDGIKFTTSSSSPSSLSSSSSSSLPKSTSILVAVTITNNDNNNNNNKNPIIMNGNNAVIISDSKSIQISNENIVKNDKQSSSIFHSLPAQPQPQSIITIIDENSNISIKSSSSSSSSSIENSPKRKRRRGEEQRLMDDLQKIDSSLAAKVTRMIESEQQQQQQNGSIENSDKIKNEDDSQTAKNCDQQQKSTANDAKSSSSGDCPALHLRPRRNIRPNPFTTAVYLSSSGSSSPIFLSPIKCTANNNQSPSKNYLKTQNLLIDTTKQLNKFLSNSPIKQELSTNDSDDIKLSKNILIDKENDSNVDGKKSSISRRKKILSIDRYVRRDLDVSVFATLITPAQLKISQKYPYNYVSLKILEQKSIRFVELIDSKTKRQFTCPILELITIDIPDRFDIDYMNGVFDEPEVSSVSNTKLTVFLVGSYALKSKSLINSDSNKLSSSSSTNNGCNDNNENEKIINILRFRTSREKLPSPITRNLKKRKFIHGNRTPEYPFTIIVDSSDDLMENFIMKNEQMKTDNNDDDDDDDEVIALDDPFIDLYNNNHQYDDNNNDDDDDDWLPMVSYSERWQPPKDPRELNRSLYIIQPCIPKFESSSRTVKMSTSSSVNASTIMA
ncbi:uncharacterized protein LOC113798713 [Dermatophagoides pteronyssinus]|uniref:uncharacterized protein LOC113798713 n=1 Tax=Dermatophagoides pteronyssinus TaxID=6956 RepID=UPI003F6610AE